MLALVVASRFGMLLGLVPIGNLQAGVVAERFGAAAALFVGAAGIVLTLLIVRVAKPIPGGAS